MPIVFIIFILLFQIIYGSIALKGKTRLTFSKISTLTIFLNIIASVIGYIQISNNLEEKEVRCGMPLLAYILFVIFSFIVLVFIIALQTTIKYIADNRKLKKQQ